MRKHRSAFTAAVSKGNPGVGGYAFAVERATGSYFTKSGASSHSTGNCMKLRAVVAAAEYMADDGVIFTDSAYVVHGAETWRHKWKETAWRGSSGRKIENVLLWKRLDAKLSEQPALKVKYLRGNKLYAQKIALEAAEQAAADRLSVHLDR